MKTHISRIIKIICILLGVLFFIPAFTVSCGGEKVADVSPFQSIFGYYQINEYSEQQSEIHEPEVWCIIMLILPAMLLIVWCLFNLIKKPIITYIASFGCVITDFIMWSIFKNSVYNIASTNYADVSIKFGYIGTMLSLIIVTILLIIHALMYYKPSVFEKNIKNDNLITTEELNKEVDEIIADSEKE